MRSLIHYILAVLVFKTVLWNSCENRNRLAQNRESVIIKLSRPKRLLRDQTMDEIQLAKVCETEAKEQALLFKAVLEQEGMDVMIKGLESSALGEAIDGADVIELFVKVTDVEQAKRVVDEILAEDGEPIPAWTCECGESVDEGFFVLSLIHI